MSVSSIVIIWCDVSFENDKSYQSMRNEFNQTTTASPEKPANDIDMLISNEEIEELCSNNAPLITARTADDAMRKIEEHKSRKIFIISSGTVGKFLIPEIVSRYHTVHDFYIYTHNIALYVEWAANYPKMLKFFDFHTKLLLRLTRDIADYFIKQGQMFLSLDTPEDALKLFNHAQKLEIGANLREKMQPAPNSTEPSCPQPDFRDNLDLLEGENGLISQAEDAIHVREHPLQNS